MKFKELIKNYTKELLVLGLILSCISGASSYYFYMKGGKDFDREVIKQEALLMEAFQPNYDQMKEEYEKIKLDFETKQKIITTYEEDITELESKEAELKEVIEFNQEIVDKVNESETVLADLESKKNDLETENSSLEKSVNNLKTEKEDLQAEIDKLNGELVQATGSPIELDPGMWFQGTDEIPVGRYTVSNGDSNFFVYDEDGNAYVNIILDDTDSGWGVTEYTFVLIEGSIIETDSGCTLTPVG